MRDGAVTFDVCWTGAFISRRAADLWWVAMIFTIMTLLRVMAVSCEMTQWTVLWTMSGMTMTGKM